MPCCGRVLPVEVKAVEAILPDDSDGRLDEDVTVCGVGHHVAEDMPSVGAFVIEIPPPNGQQHLEVRALSLQFGNSLPEALEKRVQRAHLQSSGCVSHVWVVVYQQVRQHTRATSTSVQTLKWPQSQLSYAMGSQRNGSRQTYDRNRVFMLGQ